ncbi:hypothetical protein PQE74_gp085 [Bacillus phage vB_BanS_Chewbecca]|uniref:Uncharacterized protein n=1 Tax=Bacillus phage vB_BanS_Chewbecca TaxID=2894786 RepID=A0AAE8YR97_9CAUD|nr:hypothetical protein PQE74_gp085 [Bacillus phage vB_BanS_Chewbecca]UGO46168.1 hypothetical protein CHEWBECCA_85 [Bacillus phage vB_BanS_Chewbecca]
MDDCMIRKALLKSILYSAGTNVYGGKIIEFYNLSGLFANISIRDGFVKFNTGQNIILTKSFLNAEWDVVSNQKTLVEAFQESVTTPNVLSIRGAFGSTYSDLSSSTGLGTTVNNFLTLSLQDLAEKKNWFVRTSTPPNYNFKSPSVPEGTDPMLETFDFTGAIGKMLEFTTPKYLIQFGTNKKVFLDTEGVKDATTSAIIELVPTLYTDGKWYVGENVQGEDTMLTITDALNTINWNTQELVYGKGTTAEFTIGSQSDYENKTLSNLLVGKTEVTMSRISKLLVDANWTLKNK